MENQQKDKFKFSELLSLLWMIPLGVFGSMFIAATVARIGLYIIFFLPFMIIYRLYKIYFTDETIEPIGMRDLIIYSAVIIYTFCAIIFKGTPVMILTVAIILAFLGEIFYNKKTDKNEGL